LAKPGRNLSRFGDRPADADPTRNPRAQRTHESFDRFVCRKAVHIARPILQSRWRRFTTNDDENIHTESLPPQAVFLIKESVLVGPYLELPID
jgi:hypothetical protein